MWCCMAAPTALYHMQTEPCMISLDNNKIYLRLCVSSFLTAANTKLTMSITVWRLRLCWAAPRCVCAQLWNCKAGHWIDLCQQQSMGCNICFLIPQMFKITGGYFKLDLRCFDQRQELTQYPSLSNCLGLLYFPSVKWHHAAAGRLSFHSFCQKQKGRLFLPFSWSSTHHNLLLLSQMSYRPPYGSLMVLDCAATTGNGQVQVRSEVGQYRWSDFSGWHRWKSRIMNSEFPRRPFFRFKPSGVNKILQPAPQCTASSISTGSPFPAGEEGVWMEWSGRLTIQVWPWNHGRWSSLLWPRKTESHSHRVNYFWR